MSGTSEAPQADDTSQLEKTVLSVALFLTGVP